MSRYNRRPTIFDGQHSPSLRLLQGLEKAIPPSAELLRITLSPTTLTPLPPVPKLVTENSPSVIPPSPSSFDTRSPGTWEPPASWNAQQMPDQPFDFRYHETYSASSPQLTMKEPALPIWEPMTYVPLLPESSPGLTATSCENSDIRLDADFHALDGSREEQLWTDLPPTPPSSEPQLLPPPRVLQLQSQGSSEPLASPSTPSPVLPHFARSLSPPLDHLKAPWSPGITNQTDATSVSSAPSKGSLIPGAAHVHDNSIEKALSNLGINEDGSDDPRGRSFARTRKRVTSKEQTETGSGMLSENYHNALVEQYRALAAPTVGQWDESSDEEEAVSNFRLIPKPLFWIHNERDASMAPMGEQRYDAQAHLIGYQRRSSLSDAPLKLTLPSHYRSKSDESSRSPVAKHQKHSTILFGPKNLFRRKTKASKEKNQIPASPSLPQQLHITMADSLTQSSERSRLNHSNEPTTSPRFPHGTLQSAVQKHSGGQEEDQTTSQCIDLAQLDDQSSRNSAPTSRAKSMSADTSSSIYSTPSESDRRTMALDPSYPCGMDCNPTHFVRPESQGDQHEPLSNRIIPRKTGQAGLKGIIARAKDSIGPAMNPRSPQPSNTNSDHSSKRDSKELSTTKGNEEKDSFRLPTFIQKAFESQREQAREKRKEELKKMISVVGEADPIHDIEYDVLNRRRATFGEGWV